MNFRKSSKGGGSFSIQKFILQIFAIIDDTLVMNFRKNLQYDFPKNEGGGSKAVWNFSENSSVLVANGFPKLNASAVIVVEPPPQLQDNEAQVKFAFAVKYRTSRCAPFPLLEQCHNKYFLVFP